MGTFWKKPIFGKIIIFASLYKLWAKFFGTFGKKVLAGLSKIQSECPGENILRTNNFWNKSMFFFIVFELLSTFFSELWQKYFSTIVLTAFYLSRGRVWAEIFFLDKTFLCHFRFFIEKFGISGKKISADLSSLPFTSKEERFADCFLEKWIFFISFSDVICKKKYPNFGEIISEKFSKFKSGCPGEQSLGT